MRIGNLSGRLTLFTDRGAVDVAQASGGRFSSDPQAIYDVWDDFVSWASTLDLDRSTPPTSSRPTSKHRLPHRRRCSRSG